MKNLRNILNAQLIISMHSSGLIIRIINLQRQCELETDETVWNALEKELKFQWQLVHDIEMLTSKIRAQSNNDRLIL